VTGLVATLGSGAMTNSLEDMEHARCILLIGSNTTECHPLVARRMMRAKGRGAQLLVVDPRPTQMAGMANCAVQPRPGTDVALINAMARIIISENLHAADLGETTEGFDAFREHVLAQSVEDAAAASGVPAAKIERLARLYAQNSPAALCYAMGITQFANGAERVKACSNLALLTGNIGVPGGGINPLRGQNNVQGACDMGCLPDVLPGYQKVTDAEARRKMENAWGCTLPDQPGIRLTELPRAILDGKVKALYIIGENPLLSDPDTAHMKEALGRLSLLAVQDIFRTQTAEMAHIVLPAAAAAEKDGTFTNTERRCSRIRAAVPAPGEALGDGEILCRLAVGMGHPWQWRGAEAVFNEMRALTPQYAGMSYTRLGMRGLQWPCPDEEHPGTPILHTQGCTRGKGLFCVVHAAEPAEAADAEYPLRLSTGRNFAHYHTATMSGVSPALAREGGEAYAEMHPGDAAALQLAEGSMVRLVTRRGSVSARLRLRPGMSRGMVFLPFHYAQSPANALTLASCDPQCGIPELKNCAVRVEHA
jgi:predicted molibdopterin-dependent oxidoreductase YjgC